MAEDRFRRYPHSTGGYRRFRLFAVPDYSRIWPIAGVAPV